MTSRNPYDTHPHAGAAKRFVSGAIQSNRAPYPGYSNELQVQFLLRDFDTDVRAPGWAATSFQYLYEGLATLNDRGDAYATYTGIRDALGKRKALGQFIEEVSATLEQVVPAEETSSEEHLRLKQTTLAWLTQDPFELWLRIRRFEENVGGLAQDFAVDLLMEKRAPSDFKARVDEAWATLVDAWIVARKAGRPDPLLDGVASP